MGFNSCFKSSIFVVLLVFTGCNRPPLNLTAAKDNVAEYYESCAFGVELQKVVDNAKKHFSQPAPAVPHPVIIFDIDETILSSYCDMKSIQFGFVPKLNHEWIMRSEAPVMLEGKELYDHVRAQGYKIIFLTGRKHNEYEATVANLRHCSFAEFEKLIVRSEEEALLTASEYKARRRQQLVNQGYTICGCVGDQESDFAGGNTGHRVKFPNYLYQIM